MSILVHLELKLGVHLEVRKKLVAEEKLVQTPGKPICEDRLIQLTGVKSCHLHKVLILTFDYNFNV